MEKSQKSIISPIEGRIGSYVESSTSGEKVHAYIPPSLPPSPPLDMTDLQPLLEEANHALGRLDGMTSMLPDISLFLYMYVRKEAVLSSQIEGTQSSLSDLLAYENARTPGVPFDDIQEVSNYVAAMTHGIDRIKNGFPLSLRLVREMHEILLQNSRGAEKNPGAFRHSQNWIGGTRPGNALYVPPPPLEMEQCLDAFEKFLHDDTNKLPLLVRAGLAHVQFESIHPFLDGNGRTGRLLITLLLYVNKALQEPVLYLSLYFKQNRQIYYRLLQETREYGTWETWLEFFLTGVRNTAQQATEAIQEILSLFKKDRAQIESSERVPMSILRVHDWLQKNPITSVESTQKGTKLSYATANAALINLEKMGIVKEVTGGKRNRSFAYINYINILSKGTEPLKENE